MAFTITLTEIKSLVNADGSIGQVAEVRFTPSKTVEDISATLNVGLVIPASYAPAQIPFDTVTEADIDAWIRDLYPEAQIEAELDLKLSAEATPKTTTQVPWQSAYPLWANGIAYAVEAVVIYSTETEFGKQDIGYECVQAHTSQLDWTPPATPALWKIFVDESAGVQEWVQPTGAQDAYDIGDEVYWDNPNDGGNLWVYSSLIPANTTEPGRDGTFDRWWQPDEPYTP
jgi:hypothetical protein